MDKGNGKLAAVPSADTFGTVHPRKRDMQFVQPFFDAVTVGLIPVRHQKRFSVGGFDDVLQSVQFAVVDEMALAELVINRTVCHLCQLSAEDGGISGSDFLVLAELHHILGFEILIGPGFRIAHNGGIRCADQFWHFEMVGGLHRNGDVGDRIIYGLFGERQRLIGIHDLTVALVRGEVVETVVGDEPSEAFAHIQNPELCPQVHQTVSGGSAGQTYDAFHKRSDFQQALEPLCLAVLEGGKLIDHHHIEVERDAAFLDEP